MRAQPFPYGYSWISSRPESSNSRESMQLCISSAWSMRASGNRMRWCVHVCECVYVPVEEGKYVCRLVRVTGEKKNGTSGNQNQQ